MCLFTSAVLERRYPKEVQDMYDAMRRFARVLGPTEHDKFIESHACECVSSLQSRGRVAPLRTFTDMPEPLSLSDVR